jgi:ParB family chromosome partitioning protein
MSVANTSQPQAPPAVNGGAKLLDPTPAVNHPVDHHHFQNLPIGKVVPSKTNPRKSFEGPEMDELVESIRALGILQPILVRERMGTVEDLTKVSAFYHALDVQFFKPGEPIYEVVAGERRYRAALSANQTWIPGIVRIMTDEQVLEAQIVENLQRKDVSPLEEAFGYQTLLKAMKAERAKLVNVVGKGDKAEKSSSQDLVQTIAQRVGKSARYIYARLKLTELGPEAKEALEAGKITPSHADELVRLQPAQQKKAISLAFEQNYKNGKYVPDESRPLPIRRFKDRLFEEFKLSLKDAPFKLDDATLLPKAGACTACTKNTANQYGGEHSDPQCTDKPCFNEKREALVQIRVDKACEKAGLKSAAEVLRFSSSYSQQKDVLSHYEWVHSVVKVGSCDSAKVGVVIDGPEGGSIKAICKNGVCKVHHPEAAKAAAAQRKKADPRAAAKEACEEKLRNIQDLAVFKAVARNARHLDGPLLDQLIENAFDGCDSFDLSDEINADARREVCRLLSVDDKEEKRFNLYNYWTSVSKSITANEKTRLLLLIFLLESLADGYNAPDLDTVAKGYKLDPKKIREEAVRDHHQKLFTPKTPSTKNEKLLYRALHHFADADKRQWDKLRAKGCTDAELKKALGEELGDGGQSGPDGHICYKGGSDPRIWFKLTAAGDPSLKGSELVAAVRDLMAIREVGMPKDSSSPKAAAKTKAAKKGGRK